MLLVLQLRHFRGEIIKTQFNIIQFHVRSLLHSWLHLFSCPILQEHSKDLLWLLYNKPLEYAQMVLSGEMERYLSLGCEHGRLED